MSRDQAWLTAAMSQRRCGVKGPGAAAALAQLGIAVPAQPNSWMPLGSDDSDPSSVIGRLGATEFFLEEAGDAPAIAELEELLARGRAGAYPVLREDCAVVLGGARAAEVLAQVCNVNLAALALETRPIVMTLMIGVSVLVLPQVSDEQGRIYRIWCDPSFGTYLEAGLTGIVQKIQTGRAQ